MDTPPILQIKSFSTVEHIACCDTRVLTQSVLMCLETASSVKFNAEQTLTLAASSPKLYASDASKLAVILNVSSAEAETRSVTRRKANTIHAGFFIELIGMSGYLVSLNMFDHECMMWVLGHVSRVLTCTVAG